MLNKKFKKAISAVTMFATVVCLSGVSMLAPLSASAATLVDGDLVKSNATNSDGTPALSSLDIYIVKMVGTKTFKRLVLNPQIFNSYGHLKWGNIKTVSQAEIDAIKTSSLVRVDGDTKVYALTPVAGGDTGAKSWVNVTADQFITGAGSDPDSIYTINGTDSAAYGAKADITTVTQLKAFYKDGTLPAGVASGDLTVSLSAATAEAMSIPIATTAEFASINLAAGSTAVSISSLTVTASGFGTAENIDNVALYVDGAKLGSSKNINSEKEAVFNFSNPIEISAGASKTLIIKATAAAAGTYKLGIKEAADVITGGSVGGSFPIYGNGMAADANVTTGHVTMAAVETADTTNSFGEDSVLLAGFDLTANHEGAIVESMRLKNGGTNAEDILSNLKLVADGDEIAEGSYDASTDFVTFEVNGDFKIGKGETASFEVYGDLGVSEANDTIKLFVKDIDDFVFNGEDYGFGVQLDAIPAAIDAAGDAIVVTFATGDVTIDMNKAATPAADVKADTDNVVLGTFTVVSNAENATLEQIVDNAGDEFEIQGADIEAGDIENVEMKDVDTGAIYDIAATRVSDTQWTLSMTDEINLVKGVKKTFEIRVDLNSTIDANATLKVVIDKEAMKITGDVSDATITDITPATVTSSIATVKAASLDWTTTSLTAKTAVPGATDVVIYQASLEAGTVDDVKLSSVVLGTTANTSDDFTDVNISSIDLYLNGVKIKSVSGDIVEVVNGVSIGTITFNSLKTTDGANVIKAGTTVTLEAKANFASTLTSTAAFNLAITEAATSIIVRSAADNATFAETVKNEDTGSRAVQVATKGTMKVELLMTNAKADNDTLMLAGSVTASDKYLGELKFTTANEKINLTDLKLIGDGTFSNVDVAEVYLVDAAGAIKATKIPDANGDVVFSSMNIELAADQSTSYFIAVKAKGMNVDGDAASTARQGRTVQFHINPAASSIKAKGVDSGLDITLAVSGDATIIAGEWSQAATVSKTATISGTVLNSVVSALTDGTLQGGQDKIIGKYTLVFDNGSNRTTTNEELKAVLTNLALTVSQSGALTLGDYKVYRDDAPATVVGADVAGTPTWTNLATLADGGKVDGSVTLVITADVTTTAAVGEYLQTSIATPSTTVAYTADGTAVTNSYLGVTSVSGATLSE